MSSNKMALDALTAAQRAINSMKVEAETAGAGGDQEMLQDACEQISNEGLAADTAIRAAIAALQAEPQPSMKETQLSIAFDALDEIALAGMSGTGMESEEAMTAWHARRAWEFIGIAARAKTAIRALPATPPKD